MVFTTFKFGLLCALFAGSSAWSLFGIKPHVLWKANLVLISLIDNQFISDVDAVPPPDEVKKLKEKIRKGKELLEDLNDYLESIKKSLEDKVDVEKETLEKIIRIKDDFKQLKVDPTDLSKDLLERFKEKTLEAFKLILESYGLNKMIMPQNAESQHEDNQIDNKVKKKFGREL